jgi:hypothetical protein
MINLFWVFAEADSLLHDSLKFLLFYQPKNLQELIFLFELYQFDYPVFIDETGKINQLNKLPQAQMYQCFLLDRQNKIISIGNPVYNKNVWELYISIISNRR